MNFIIKRFGSVQSKSGPSANWIKRNPKGDSGIRAPPDTYAPAAAEIWSGITGKNPPPSFKETQNDYFQDSLYTPPAKPYTGIGPIKFPLKYPEFDQKTLSSQASGLPAPGAWRAVSFDDPNTAPIGQYPKIEPQWTQLKDPHQYWDKQGRRNYGDILYDHDNFTDYISIGPEIHWWLPFQGFLKAVGLIALGSGLVILWDPRSHLWFAEKEYPYEGLRAELGGDPKNEDDNWMSTNARIRD